MLEDVARNRTAQLFEENFDPEDEGYDPEVDLVGEEFHRHGPVGFNDFPEGDLVHPTRASLGYALTLLDSGDREYYDRAFRVIDAVIDAQSTDRDADYYGCWPWYVEVPLEEMVTVDYNWSAFLGRKLAVLLSDHGERLPEDLRERVRDSLYRATDLIVRRNMGPDYTNISLMSAFVAVKAGELLEDDELLSYGREKLREAVGYTRYHDDVTEYNSPTYTRVSLYDVGRMLAHFDSDADRSLARVLNDRIWRSLSRYYHPETGQLSGPHIRTYDDFQGGTIGSIIGIGTDGRYGITALEEMDGGTGMPKVILDCPKKYFGNFGPTEEPAFYRNQFFRGNREYQNEDTAVPFSQFASPVEARTYFTDRFTLGSFTRMDCWNQRRSLLGYWGSPEEPYRFRMRCLSDRHGGYDFSSAAATLSQYENHVLGAVSFLTDTRRLTDGERIDLGSLRVRFEVAGDTETRAGEVENDGDTYRFDAGGMTVEVDILHVEFDDEESHVTTGYGTDSDWIDSGRWVDAVLFDGEERTVDLSDVDRGVVVFGVSMAPGPDAPDYDYSIEGGTMDAEMTPLEYPGSITVPVSAGPPGEYFERSEIDGAFSGQDVDGYGSFE
ncbi:MAG: hypothetical protein ABEH88_10700 [Halobacteriales archaeon]